MNEDAIIDGILKAEGGWVDHPDDKGGPTNRGIILRTLEDWRKVPVTVDDLKALTEKETREIYRDLYVHRPGFHLIMHDKLRALMVDSGVNHGTHRVCKWLQEILGVIQDGVIGPTTLVALAGANGDRLYLRICGKRARLYGRIITDNPRQSVFAAGWGNRLADWIEGLA